MENELRKEGARPPTYREDRAGCSAAEHSGFLQRNPASPECLAGGKNHLRKVGGSWRAKENEKPWV